MYKGSGLAPPAKHTHKYTHDTPHTYLHTLYTRHTTPHTGPTHGWISKRGDPRVSYRQALLTDPMKLEGERQCDAEPRTHPSQSNDPPCSLCAVTLCSAVRGGGGEELHARTADLAAGGPIRPVETGPLCNAASQGNTKALGFLQGTPCCGQQEGLCPYSTSTVTATLGTDPSSQGPTPGTAMTSQLAPDHRVPAHVSLMLSVSHLK